MRAGHEEGGNGASYGRYRLLDRIAQGAMAEVFRAKSFGVEGFEKTLVVKRVLAGVAREPGFAGGFIERAKLVVRLSHANVVQVFDVGAVEVEGEPSYFLAMELVAGLDLGALVARAALQGRSLPMGLAVYVASEAAKGLDHAHRRRDERSRPLGIVHGDVRPSNVLVSWEGEVKLADFAIGLARRPEALSPAKLRYASPERLEGRAVDAQSDIFSLAAVLYELLSGVPPFAARAGGAEALPIETLRADVPADLAALLGRALAVDPATRHKDAGRFYEDLVACLYASSPRAGAAELAAFVAELRGPESAPPDAGWLEADAPPPPVGSTVPVASAAPPPTPRRKEALDGERRDVSALVVVPSTIIAGADAPRAALATIERLGGRLVEAAPDRVVALFGLDDGDGRDVETAARAALLVLRGFAAAGDESAGAAVDVARVVRGADGRHADDAALRATIGAAAALAGSAIGSCIASARASSSLRAHFELVELPTGEDWPPGATLVAHVRSPESALGRFVGRRDELRVLGELMALASRGRLSVVTVRGDRGVGKTRLLVEVQRRLVHAGAVGVTRASCPPRALAEPLSGLVALLHAALFPEESDTPRADELALRLRALGMPPDETSAVLALFGVEPDDRVTTQKAGDDAPRSQGAALVHATARVVAALSSDRPHVFVVDDAQALDDESGEILLAALERSRASRAVFLVATNMGETSALEAFSRHHGLALGPLDEESVAELVADRMGARAAPAEVVDVCLERAGGHPLFTEELVRDLVASGAVVVEHGGVTHVALDGEVAPPRPLRALLASRLSTLDPRERDVLDAIAILGDPAREPVLAAMIGEPVSAIDRVVTALADRALVHRTDAVEVGIGTSVLRDVLIDAMPESKRASLHGLAAKAYSAVLGSSAKEQAARIAAHLAEAGDREGEASFRAREGERYAAARRWDAAARAYARALEVCEPELRPAEDLAAWLEALAAAVARSRRPVPRVREAIVERIDDDGELEARVAARIALARVSLALGRLDEAERTLDAARVLASGAPSTLRRVLVVEAEWLATRGRFREAASRFHEVLAPGALDAHEEHRLRVGHAHALGALGEPERALTELERAASLAGDADLGAACVRARCASLVHRFAGDLSRAVAEAERAVALARRGGAAADLASSLRELGDALTLSGEHARAHATLEQALAIGDELGMGRLRGQTRALVAYLDAVSGLSSGSRAVEALADAAERDGLARDAVDARLLLARLHVRAGRADEARVVVERARADAEASGYLAALASCDALVATLAV